MVNCEQTSVASEGDNSVGFVEFFNEGNRSNKFQKWAKQRFLRQGKQVMSITGHFGHLMARSQGRLLVVEDQRSNRELLADILVSEGYEVVTAEDGLDALNQLVEPLPDGIISDLAMPRMSGFEFLEVVRQQFPHIPVLVISGEFEGNVLPTGVLADAYLEKGSFSFNQLRTKIEDLLSAPPRKLQPAAIGFVTA